VLIACLTNTASRIAVDAFVEIVYRVFGGELNKVLGN
jgi:hypothetical protein